MLRNQASLLILVSCQGSNRCQISSTSSGLYELQQEKGSISGSEIEVEAATCLFTNWKTSIFSPARMSTPKHGLFAGVYFVWATALALSGFMQTSPANLKH